LPGLTDRYFETDVGNTIALPVFTHKFQRP
jgi:hypothetical protein